MQKKSSSRSAFFTLRVLIGVSVIVVGVSLALLGSKASSTPSSFAKAQQKKSAGEIDLSILPPGFDCSRIREFGIDKQENMRAGMIMIACGAAEGGWTPHASALNQSLQNFLSPLNYGGSDVDLVTPLPETTSPHVTQSETFSWGNPDNPSQILVAYNDSRGAALTNYSGASFSTDGG